MSEKSSEVKFMSALYEASFLVRQIAAPATGKAALLQAYRKIGTWTYNRVKDIYYADRRARISADEIDALRTITRAGQCKNNARATDPSIAELREQLALVVSHLQRIDPTFHHPSIEALSRMAHSDGVEENSSSGTDGEPP